MAAIDSALAPEDHRKASGVMGEGVIRVKPAWPRIRPESYGLFDRVIFAMFVLAVPTLLGSSWSVFRDGDVSWHVAAGRWILEHGQIPRNDPFSTPMAGTPWVPHEWLAEIVLASAFNFASYAGLSAVVVLALIALNAIVFHFLRPRIGPLGLFLTMAVLAAGLLPFILARPHVLAWPFLAGWTATLLIAREKGRSPPLALALLMFVWANMHASFIIGFVIAGAVALDEWKAHRFSLAVVRRWLPFGIASLLAVLLNANGIAGVVHPLSISGMESLPDIGEWKPSTPGNSKIFFPVLIGGLAVILIRRPKFTPGELILLLGSLTLAFLHLRHQAMFILFAAFIIPPKLALAERTQPIFDSERERSLVLAGLAVVTFAIALIVSQSPIEPKEGSANPRNLIAHITPEMRSKPVFNDYSMGGPLILYGIRPWIDGRADMYGDDHVQDYLKMVGGDFEMFKKIADRHGIQWTILEKNAELVEELDRSPEWRRAYQDNVGIIHLRAGAEAAGAIGRNRQVQEK